MLAEHRTKVKGAAGSLVHEAAGVNSAQVADEMFSTFESWGPASSSALRYCIKGWTCCYVR